MGTLRKVDSRITRFKVHVEGKHKHDDMRLHERMTAAEAVLPALATKEDLAKEIGAVRAEMHQGFTAVHKELHALTWRLVCTMVTVGTALVAATHFILKSG
ncbi:hypothetical protein AB870_17110 [Pandoraea faecigallinarum]|uniref:Transmembrane protein n=2 Tax=Pandoraea faecigallinarum TaxID=656179 RepID=A0A0H3WV01_9BURK|nr:hypothetical protein AB870_17110 [Pandoraea faecigallinarum]